MSSLSKGDVYQTNDSIEVTVSSDMDLHKTDAFLLAYMYTGIIIIGEIV